MRYNLTSGQIDEIIAEMDRSYQVVCVECMHRKKCKQHLKLVTGCIFPSEEHYKKHMPKED